MTIQLRDIFVHIVGPNEYAGDCCNCNPGGDFDTSNAVTVVSRSYDNTQTNTSENKLDVIENPYYGVKNAYSKGVYAIKIVENNYYGKRSVI